MVAIDALRALDEAGVAESLFSSARLEKALPPAFILEFGDKAGNRLCARIYEAAGDNPHVFYLPAEFDTDDTLHLLGTGLLAIGFSMIALEYPGVGKSQGRLTFQGMFQAIAPFYDAARLWMKEQGRDGPVVLMGRSLGCVMALHQAVNRQDECLCLIMESAFDSGQVFLERSGIETSSIPKGPIFENRNKMKQFKKPVLFIHSPRDTVQSLTEVEWLVAESRSKATQFQIAPSGTRQELANQVGELYLEVVQQWVNLRRGVRPPRKRRPIF